MNSLKPGWVDQIAKQARKLPPAPVPLPCPPQRTGFLDRCRGRRFGREGSEAEMAQSRLRGAYKAKLNQHQAKALDFAFPEDEL